MKCTKVLVLGVLVSGLTANAQQLVVSFDRANPKLTGVRITPSVTTADDGLFEYRYVVQNGQPSTGAVLRFALDVRSSDGTGQALPNGVGGGRVVGRFNGPRVCSIGLIPPLDWRAMITKSGFVSFSTDARDPTDPDGIIYDFEQMAPGKTSPVLAIVSQDPPGIRGFFVEPQWEPALGSNYASLEETYLTGQTIGPLPIAEGEPAWFRGGSNNPAVVDRFLAFRAPTEKTTTLTAGQKAIVIIKFGPTTLPGTFSATWNGVDVTSQFAVKPGSFAAVQLEPKSGKNILAMSINGTKSGGQRATDSDKLIWQAP